MRPAYAILLAERVSPKLSENLSRARQSGVSLLVVDDGSPEGAAKVATRAGVWALRHPARFGRAQALLTGVHYAITDESPGALIIASADSPGLDATLWALAEAAAKYPREVIVSGDAGPLGERAYAAAGLWRWWRRGEGPAYAAPTEAFRDKSLTPLDRGPELAFLVAAARGSLGLRALPITARARQTTFAV